MDLAQKRAEHIAMTGEFEHYQTIEAKILDGTLPVQWWPNDMLFQTGYRLPPWWRRDANYIESLAIGYLSATEALEALHASPSHRKHMAGLDFWSDHLRYGVGFAAVQSNRAYVIWTAPVEPNTHYIYLPHIGKPLVNEG